MNAHFPPPSIADGVITVASPRNKAAEHLGLEATLAEIQLTFAGREMSRDRTSIEDYGCKSGSLVVVSWPEAELVHESGESV